MSNHKRLLFLDDDPIRQKLFQDRVAFEMQRKTHLSYTLRAVTTAANCILELAASRWDYVFLDHDLGGETFVDSDREDCGMEVVRYLSSDAGVNSRYSQTEFIIHSHNTPAAIRMSQELMSFGAYWVHRIPFATLIKGIFG